MTTQADNGTPETTTVDGQETQQATTTTQEVDNPGLQFSKEQSPTPDKQPTNDDVIYEYSPTGDAGLDLALSFVGNLGIANDHPAMVQAAQGNFDSLEKHLASLGDLAKGYEAYVKVARESVSRGLAAAKSAEQATLAAVHETVGGEENWKQIAAFVSEHADDNERAEIDAAFKKGGIAAKSMATYLANTYNNSKGRTNSKQVVKSDASGTRPDNGALSPRQYASELKRLQREGRGRPVESHPEYNGLRQRALAFQQR